MTTATDKPINTVRPNVNDLQRRAPVPAPAEPAPEKPAQITIAVTPAGLTITAAYTGPLSSIPAAIERLRSAGILDLVAAREAAPTTPPAKKSAPKVAPAYNESGEACCPVHRRVLSEGQYGLFCSAKAKGDEVADKKGYCGLKFEE